MINHSSCFTPLPLALNRLTIQPHRSTPSGPLSQWELWSGEAGGPSQTEKSARGLLQTDSSRSAGDEHGSWGLHVLQEGKGELEVNIGDVPTDLFLWNLNKFKLSSKHTI